MLGWACFLALASVVACFVSREFGWDSGYEDGYEDGFADGYAVRESEERAEAKKA